MSNHTFFSACWQDWGSVVKDDLAVYAMAHLTKYHIPEAATINLLGGEEKVKWPFFPFFIFVFIQSHSLLFPNFHNNLV